MAKNKTTFTPGPGDADYVPEPFDSQAQRWADALADVKKNFPSQDLKHFRIGRNLIDMASKRGEPGKKFNVFYLDAEGHEFCPRCANQKDVDGPPIIAGQLNGDRPEVDEARQCDGCGVIIHPLYIFRKNVNMRYVWVRNGDEWKIIFVHYETPVAVFTLGSREFFYTDIAWSRSTESAIGDFQWDMREEIANSLGVKRTDIPYQQGTKDKQENLDELLKTYIGSIRLDERPNTDHTFHPLIATDIHDYDGLRASLAEAKTDKVVVKPNRRIRSRR